MTTINADVCVIGLGSAGEQLATRLAENGASVVGFEPHRVGGECPYVACIPSKAMLHDASHGRSWSDAVERRDGLANHRNDDQHAEALTNAGVRLVREFATLAGERTVESESHRVSADHVVLAVGAEPVRPPIDGIHRTSVWTSAQALSSDRQPNPVVIIGGGAIGSELGEVYRRFGSDVTICDHGSQLIADAHPDVSNALGAHLSSLGVDIRLDTEVDSIQGTHDSSMDLVRLTDGSELAAARVLLAAGTTPRLGHVGLQHVGLDPEATEISTEGSVAPLDWLWAVGDVTPHSGWTHGASIQARALADRLGGEAWPQPATVMPRCVFTNPPLAVVERSPGDARRIGTDVIVGAARYRDTARAATDEVTEGIATVTVDRETSALLGASLFGSRADDIIQVMTAFIASGSDLGAARHTVFPFPTLSQVLEVALADAAAAV